MHNSPLSGSARSLIAVNPDPAEASPVEPTGRLALLATEFAEAQLPAVHAMDDLLSVLKYRDCDPVRVASVSETTRAALDRLWSAASRVVDFR
jgi:hypothetical protein